MVQTAFHRITPRPVDLQISHMIPNLLNCKGYWDAGVEKCQSAVGRFQLLLLVKADLDCLHMYANDVRFAMQFFWLPLISAGVLTCIRVNLRHMTPDLSVQYFWQGSEIFAFGCKFSLKFVAKSERCCQKSQENIASCKSAV